MWELPFREIAEELTNCNIPTPRGGDLQNAIGDACDEAIGARGQVKEGQGAIGHQAQVKDGQAE
jgi:hypothetical protein